jgi:glycerol kinase
VAFILAFDQGTTSSRAIVFDESSEIRGVAQREFRQIYPAPGRVEHDANEIWSSQLAVAQEALAAADVKAADLAAIGITNQRETTVLWDRATGEPLHNAIVWQDRRTAPLCDELRDGPHRDMIVERTGLQIDPYFSGTKLAWLLENVPGARQRAAAGELAFGTVDSWLLWKLTGRHATDPSNASRTLLFDLASGDWHDDLLAVLDIPRSLLPEVRPSSGHFGEARAGLLGATVPVSGIIGDQQAALFGQMCTRPGMAKTTYGTGCFLLANTGEQIVRSENRLLTTVAWQLGDKLTYALEGSVFVGGAAVQWLRDGLGIINDSSEVEALAASVESSEGVYCVPAFAGLGAPHWDAYARGAILGLTRGSTAAHIARATLEGIAYQVADVLDAMEADRGEAISELRVDGGAAANRLLLQFQADLLGADVVRPRNLETTALGAAYMAGLAAGVWSDIDTLENRWRVDQRISPRRSVADVRDLRTGWNHAIASVRGRNAPGHS